MPVALLALTAGAFGIGTTEFVIMGLLLQVGADLNVSIAAAGLLISGYALGVAVGAPLLTMATRKLPRKTVLLFTPTPFVNDLYSYTHCTPSERRAGDFGESSNEGVTLVPQFVKLDADMVIGGLK